MTVGAEPKKVAILVALLGGAGFLFYHNLSGGGETVVPVQTPTRADSASAAMALNPGASPGRTIARRTRAQGNKDFPPKIGFDRNEERPDLTKIDPTLRFDLLAKVQSVERSGGVRNLFQFSIALNQNYQNSCALYFREGCR